MIVRPLTFLTGLAFAFSGAYLFVVKHQSQSLEDRLGQLAQTSRADEQAIRVLKAQWALEADPSRIAALAAEFTQLKPMQPSQLVTLASLSSSLPAPGSPAPYSNPEDMMPAMPDGDGGASAPAGPAIQVHGNNVATVTGQNSAATQPATQRVAEDAAPALALPPPPPAIPRGVPAWRQKIHLAAVEHVSRSWIAPIPRQKQPLHRAESASRASHSYVVQTRAEGVDSAPTAPLGAQIVRIRAVAHEAEAVPAHESIVPAGPLGGGSLLGMAQSGSQN